MRFLFPLLVGGFSVIGCSSDDAATASPGGGSDGAAESAVPSDAAGSTDLVPPAQSGFIGVGSYASAVTTVFANSVGASFFDGPGYWFPYGCKRDVIGACAVVLCDYTDGGAAMPPPGAPKGAGTITIGGTIPAFSLQYDATTMKYGPAVPSVPTDKPLFAAGGTVTFAAAGGDVPAFADSLVATSPITITSPAIASGALSIDRSKDLVFAWTGSSVGILALNIRTTTTSAATNIATSFVSCQFKASAMTATIPTARLQKLTMTDTTTTAIIGTDLSNTKEAVAGAYQVHLAVGGVAANPDGTPYASSKVTIF